jgi:lysyl-tRNA synthetase class 2
MIRSEQEQVRLGSLQQLRDLGINPFPPEEFIVSHRSEDLRDDFKEGVEVSLAGRMMSRRIMGKASFAELKDAQGSFQLYLNRDEICPGEDKTLYNSVFKKLLDRGDFI